MEPFFSFLIWMFRSSRREYIVDAINCLEVCMMFGIVHQKRISLDVYFDSLIYFYWIWSNSADGIINLTKVASSTSDYFTALVYTCLERGSMDLVMCRPYVCLCNVHIIHLILLRISNFVLYSDIHWTEDDYENRRIQSCMQNMCSTFFQRIMLFL